MFVKMGMISPLGILRLTNELEIVQPGLRNWSSAGLVKSTRYPIRSPAAKGPGELAPATASEPLDPAVQVAGAKSALACAPLKTKKTAAARTSILLDFLNRA